MSLSKPACSGSQAPAAPGSLGTRCPQVTRPGRPEPCGHAGLCPTAGPGECRAVGELHTHITRYRGCPGASLPVLSLKRTLLAPGGAVLVCARAVPCTTAPSFLWPCGWQVAHRAARAAPPSFAGRSKLPKEQWQNGFSCSKYDLFWVVPWGADAGTFSKHLCTRGRYICVAAEVLGFLGGASPCPS